MGFIRKHKNEIIVSLVFLALFLLIRLLTLTQLPIFTDEAIYLRWAQIAKQDANWRFISLTDGKQPLFIWAVMIMLKFVHDPLIAGRLVSVGSGLLTSIGLFFLGREVFKNKWVGLLSASLYVIFPFAIVYDRMAIYDSLVGTFTVWGLYFTFLVVRRLRLDLALLMGFVSGAAVLNKTNGFFTIYLLPFSILLFDFKQKFWRKRLIKLIGLAFVVVVMTYGFYTLLRLSPYFYIIKQKNAVFFYPLGEWLKHPITYFLSNLSAFNDWFMRYVGLPIGLTALGAFVVDRKLWRDKLLLLFWFAVPYFGFALIGRTIYPRYIFPMTLSLLPMAAFTLVFLFKKLTLKKWLIVIGLVLIYWVVADYLIVTNFSKSPIPRSDKGQYLEAWPAGVGVKEATAFFQKEASKKPIFIGTGGTFGLLPYAFELTFANNPRVTIKGYWPIEAQMPKDLLESAKKQNTYMVFYQDCPPCEGVGVAPSSWPLKKIMQLKRVEPGSYFTVYQVTP